MYISPRYSVSNWKILNLSTPSDWRTAVRVLKDRLNARFFDAAEAIDQQDFAGFAVLALDCLLIETLQQFKEGVDETPAPERGAVLCKILNDSTFFFVLHQSQCGQVLLPLPVRHSSSGRNQSEFKSSACRAARGSHP